MKGLLERLDMVCESWYMAHSSYIVGNFDVRWLVSFRAAALRGGGPVQVDAGGAKEGNV